MTDKPDAVERSRIDKTLEEIKALPKDETIYLENYADIDPPQGVYEMSNTSDLVAMARAYEQLTAERDELLREVEAAKRFETAITSIEVWIDGQDYEIRSMSNGLQWRIWGMNGYYNSPLEAFAALEGDSK